MESFAAVALTSLRSRRSQPFGSELHAMVVVFRCYALKQRIGGDRSGDGEWNVSPEG
jgi:hypothetical protein